MEIYSWFFNLHEYIMQLQMGNIALLFDKNNISVYLISEAPPLNYHGLHNETVQPQ